MNRFLVNLKKVCEIYEDMISTTTSIDEVRYVKYTYPIGTFERLLKSLRNEIQQGHQVVIMDDEISNKLIFINSIAEFDKWIKDNFPFYNDIK